MNWIKSWRMPARWPLFRADDRLLLMLFAGVVGISSGLAAVLLNRALHHSLEWLHHLRRFWWFFAVPGAGAALSFLFLNRFIRERAGHGVPEVIYSVCRYGGLLRLRSSYSRLVSSWLTIGSGGSAGPEAPVVMSGAAIGSNIARYFSLNDRQRVTLVGCGAAGAIASIFNAPIAGLVFAIEVILGEWKSVNIIPIAIAAVAGTETSRLLQGNQIAFTHRQFHLSLLDISTSIGLALFCAGASILLTHSLRRMHGVADKVSLPGWVKAAIGGCAVGGIGLLLPDVLGEGYRSVQIGIHGNFPGGLMLVAGLAAMKIVATALTLGWGGSGGIFAPCLVIGSFMGLAYQRCLVAFWPAVSWANEGCFALIGMAGMISGILQAPLTGIFLIVEITGGWEVILPLIMVSAITTTLCHYIEPASFYLKDLVERGQLLRPGTDARVLSDLSVPELIESDCISVPQNMLLGDFVDIFKSSHRNYYPVENEHTGEFVGMLHLDDIRPYLFDTALYPVLIIGQIMQPARAVVGPDDDLTEVLYQMDIHRLFSLPVVSNRRFVGMISKATLLDKYRKELRVQSTG